MFLYRCCKPLPNGGYTYKTLPNAGTYIRILTLDLDRNELISSLEVYPIAHAPAYDALSYAWGNETPTASLFCDGTTISVTPHLLAGIEQIRHEAQRLLRKAKGHFRSLSLGGRKMRVWIDAICIDQVDSAEKAEQIPLMSQLYSKAERTLVWLGAAADGSELILPEFPSLTQKLFA